LDDKAMNRTGAAYDRWAASYDEDSNPQTVLEEPTVMELVSPSRADRILDAACGTGRYCRLFHEQGAEVVGVDFSPGMLHVARSRLPTIDFQEVDLTRPLPFRDGAFGKINCAQALKHLPDIRPALREFARVIAPGGAVTFSVTHPDMLWEDYELSSPPSFTLSSESDIHHHRFCDYFEAIAMAGLRLAEFRQVPVNESIREYLTAQSFEKVKGRCQIAVFQLTKPLVEQGAPANADEPRR